MKDLSTATERVGRYQLLEPIGGGPNGMVSRAKVFGVAGFERQFAVKRFAPELTAGPVATALSAAARSYGSLEHPRIARMSEFGVAQGQTFTAVEYVAGLDAFRLLQEAKLAGIAIAAGGALALVSQAARAVGYAHGRGLSHLGLAPTNVIVTVDGDVKVTDFGILAATMPPRPVESARLIHRIPYLAPEQIASESTSAATDVFVLGVIAYELVTGQRAYRGETPAQIAQAIVAGPPAEPPLPRPIVRVLQRCLARSPFERFPDARALADALDAALRVAPVPGTRKDIGAQIKTTLDRYASLNEGNLSGMVALNLQNASLPQGGALDAHDVSTQPFSRGDHARTDVSPIVPSASSTMPDLARAGSPYSTVPGLAPPPIPVPPGVTPPPGSPPPASLNPAKTIMGISPVKKPIVPGVIPPIAKGNGPPPGRPATRATPPPLPVVRPSEDEIVEPSGLVEITDFDPSQGMPDQAPIIEIAPYGEPTDSGRMPAQDPSTMQGLGAPGTLSPAALRARPPTPGQNFETRTGEMSPAMVEEYGKRSVKNTAELQSIEKPHDLGQAPLESPPYVDDPVDAFASEARAAAADLAPSRSMPVARPPSQSPVPVAQQVQATVQTRKPSGSSKAPMIVVALLLLGGGAAGGWYVYSSRKDDTKVAANDGSGSAKPIAKVTADAAVVAVATPDAAVKPEVVPPPAPDAAVVAAVAPDAAVVAAVKPDAAVADKPEVVKPTAKSDKLEIKSKPAGARVFIDGADQGVTPLKLDGSADRHTMVVLSPGHDLYISEVDGHGVFDIQLKPVTPTGGHAGIKVLKCKAKERYYVYVDGTPTGQTCPTERIDTVVGPHTVEVYDIVTDSRRKWDINVKDERLSARVKIDD
ncbi:MAG TPA: protein kinase [Kofleriaceae bacterium]